jgi:hypothetical protein
MIFENLTDEVQNDEVSGLLLLCRIFIKRVENECVGGSLGLKMLDDGCTHDGFTGAR